MATIGIDFGTTNCVAATSNGSSTDVLSLDTPPIEWEPYGFSKVMPSVFAELPDARMSFGWDAKTSTGNKFEAVKRLFASQQDLAFGNDGESLKVEEAATLLFAEIHRRSQAAGISARQAVITVPANSKGRSRHRTKICAGMGGFEVLGLINEPTAAAMAYAQRHSDGRNYLVFDWGGGTLDVTVLQATSGVFIERASAGLPTSGGLDFDARLNKAVTEQVASDFEWTPQQRSDFRLQIELAKVRLSQTEVTTLVLPDGSPFRLTRSRLEEVVRPLIEESRIPIERCFRDLGIGPGGIDALVLVGGTCKVPAVRSFVRDIVGVEPDPDIDPMTAIGEGAAIAAAIMVGDNQDNDFFVSTEHALGTFATNGMTGETRFATLIPRNHKLPAKATDTFFPVHEEQENVEIEVVEGDPERADGDMVVLKSWTIPVPEAPDGDKSFELTYEYDVSGILHVTAVANTDGRVILQGDVSYGVGEDKKKLADIAVRAQRAVAGGDFLQTDGQSDLDTESIELIQRAEVKVIPFLEDNEAAPVQLAVDGLRNASPSEVSGARGKLREAMAPFSFLF